MLFRSVKIGKPPPLPHPTPNNEIMVHPLHQAWKALHILSMIYQNDKTMIVLKFRIHNTLFGKSLYSAQQDGLWECNMISFK